MDDLPAFKAAGRDQRFVCHQRLGGELAFPAGLVAVDKVGEKPLLASLPARQEAIPVARSLGSWGQFTVSSVAGDSDAIGCGARGPLLVNEKRAHVLP
jgi:hypothetical protein